MSPVTVEHDSLRNYQSVTVTPGHTLVAGSGYHDMPSAYVAKLADAEMESEIDANPDEADSLRRARREIREGAGRWLDEGESVSDAID